MPERDYKIPPADIFLAVADGGPIFCVNFEPTVPMLPKFFGEAFVVRGPRSVSPLTVRVIPEICACAELRVFLNRFVVSPGRYASLLAFYPRPDDAPASLFADERTSPTPCDPLESTLCEKSFLRWEAAAVAV